MFRHKNKGINIIAAANSAAVITLGWMLFCRFFYIPFPGLTEVIFQSWFPAINLEMLWSKDLLGMFLVGVITLPAAAWLTVFGFLKLYYGLGKK